MLTALNASILSSCKRKKVGAVLVKDNRIISFGYNGTLPGDDNDCEDSNGKTKGEVAHAEQNAIYKVASSSDSTKGATLYVTCAPCIECSKIIIRTEIQRVVYGEIYSQHDHLKLLQSHNITVEQYDIARLK